MINLNKLVIFKFFLIKIIIKFANNKNINKNLLLVKILIKDNKKLLIVIKLV